MVPGCFPGPMRPAEAGAANGECRLDTAEPHTRPGRELPQMLE